MDRERLDETSARWPQPDQRFEMTRLASPHPAIIDTDDLVRQCTFRMQTRSGPGGQHRNRTASGVFVVYRDDNLPADVTAEATEQRNQHRNRAVAIQRLRYVLAVSVRTPSMLDPFSQTSALDALENERLQKYRGGALKLADDNPEKPGLLALILNDLHVAGGQPSLVVPHWKVSTSRLVGLIKSHSPAWTLVNRIRTHHGRLPLK